VELAGWRRWETGNNLVHGVDYTMSLYASVALRLR
jgi:hypothetical protein